METGNSLYFLHIPKTGGMTVAFNIVRLLIDNDLKRYPPSVPPHGDVSDEYAYIQGHLGRYPISKVDNLSVATLIREPLDRSISNFMWIYNNVLETRPEYAALSSIEEKLKYYLFEDPNYISHRNIQSKFICSSPAENRFKDMSMESSEDYETKSKSWYLQDVDLTVELAKSRIDELEIVDTTENLERFINKMVEWFNENYPDLVQKTLTNEIVSINRSALNDSGSDVTREGLKASLTDADIENFFNLNSIDIEVYEYVKQKNS